MCLFRKNIVFIVYKEYRNWEDDDSNGTEIIEVFKNKNHAIKSLHKSYDNELQFFAENGNNVTEKNCSDAGYYIETCNGDVEGYLTKQEVS